MVCFIWIKKSFFFGEGDYVVEFYRRKKETKFQKVSFWQLCFDREAFYVCKRAELAAKLPQKKTSSGLDAKKKRNMAASKVGKLLQWRKLGKKTSFTRQIVKKSEFTSF